MRLQRGDVIDDALRAEGVVSVGGAAIYPHPMLAPARELVVELLALALSGELTVAVAVHPFRVTAVEDVQFRLLEDYWYGGKGRCQQLDSLDPHDVGVRTFHGARQDTVERFAPIVFAFSYRMLPTAPRRRPPRHVNSSAAMPRRAERQAREPPNDQGTSTD